MVAGIRSKRYILCLLGCSVSVYHILFRLFYWSLLRSRLVWKISTCESGQPCLLLGV